MRRRVLVLPIAAVVITALVVYKSTRHEPPLREVELVERRMAPESRMMEAGPREFRLKAMLGRHRILLVFFDGRIPVTQQPLLDLLRDEYDALESQGIQVLAVSEAPPAAYKADLERAAMNGEPDSFPFRLLTDLRSVPGAPGVLVPRMTESEWAIPALSAERSFPIVFLIDRGGHVPWKNDRPQPLDDPEAAIHQLAAGEDA